MTDCLRIWENAEKTNVIAVAGAKMLNYYTKRFQNGLDLGSADAESLFDAIATAQDEMSLVDLLNSWNGKGVTTDEIFDLVTVMRKRMKRIHSSHANVIDIVGTGGSKAKTFNVSTAAAFVIAGAGIPVAKHGNRAASSKAGSADVMSMLGVNIGIDFEATEHCLEELGLCFMFAPLFHSIKMYHLCDSQFARQKPVHPQDQ